MFKWLVLSFFFAMPIALATPDIPSRDPFQTIFSNKFTSETMPLYTYWIPLYFAEAKNVFDFISNKSNQILSSNGKINFDKRSNQIWLKEDVKHATQIIHLIHHLDHSGPQFLINAKIINLDKQYQKKLGFIFQTPSISKPSENSSAGEFIFSIATLTQSHLLDLQISALESEGHAKLISSPTLITLNNQPAIIESGSEVPYEESTSSGATSVSFKKAVLRLQVTPKQMPHHYILLQISLNQDKVSSLTINGVPAIQTQKISTQAIVKNNETIVLGGIFESLSSKEHNETPGVARLPIMGELFKHHTKEAQRQELLIFITPMMSNTMF